jgi:hypothetical protein
MRGPGQSLRRERGPAPASGEEERGAGRRGRWTCFVDADGDRVAFSIPAYVRPPTSRTSVLVRTWGHAHRNAVGGAWNVRARSPALSPRNRRTQRVPARLRPT